MESELQTLPQNINLVSGNLVHDIFAKNEYQLYSFMSYMENQEYSHYSISGDSYECGDSNRSSPELLKLSVMLPSQHRAGKKNKDSFRANSPGYESDESCASYSSKRNLDNNGTKCKEKTASQKFLKRSGVFHPNLYQPNVNYNKNSNYSEDILPVERKVHGLMKRFLKRTGKLRIDPNPPDLLNDGPWDLLNQAIWNVFINRVQTEETYINKINLWKSIFIFLRMSLSNYALYMVGSTMSGFGLEGSDIDLCLLTRPFIDEPRIDSFHQLNRLKYFLLRNGLASEADLIMAKVPILKFTNGATGFKIDLNCNNAVGIRNTHLLYCYAQMDWRVRPLVVIIKIWAQVNHINDAKNMTISSYSWALMVIHYLQCGVVPPLLPCLHDMYPAKFNSHDNHNMDVHEEIEALKEFESDNTRCLGDLLIGFFQYYAYFDYSRYAISVRTGSQLPIEACKSAKSPKNDPNQWKYLCIEEPFDLSNTARSVFDLEVFKHIRRMIMCSYTELSRNKTLSHILPVSLKR